MIPKKALKIVDKTLQDVCWSNIPFAGKLIILGGDFRQILPVVKRASQQIKVEDTIKYSKLWNHFKILKLFRNIRCSNKDFSSLLLKIGERILDPFIIPHEWKTRDVCKSVYADINKSQRQSFDIVGLYMKTELFSHGQLYVALSRSSNQKKIFIQHDCENKNEIKNIVSKTVFER